MDQNFTTSHPNKSRNVAKRNPQKKGDCLLGGPGRGTWDVGDVRDVRDVRDVKDVRDVRDVRDVWDVKDVEDVKDVKDVRSPRPQLEDHFFIFHDMT